MSLWYLILIFVNMKYNSFRYIYPPRPRNPIISDDLEFWDNGSLVAQPKLNGSNCVVFTNGEKVMMMNRHSQYLTNVSIAKEEILSLFRGEVGKYFVSVFDGDLPGGLSFYNDTIGVMDELSGKSERYTNIGIFIFTSVFDEDVLKSLFGDPLYHDEFGEGFEGEYNEETDEYSEPENKFQYASYFVEIETSCGSVDH